MKTVLSNTKRFLAVFLALAMIVLALPETALMAAEGDHYSYDSENEQYTLDEAGEYVEDASGNIVDSEGNIVKASEAEADPTDPVDPVDPNEGAITVTNGPLAAPTVNAADVTYSGDSHVTVNVYEMVDGEESYIANGRLFTIANAPLVVRADFAEGYAPATNGVEPVTYYQIGEAKTAIALAADAGNGGYKASLELEASSFGASSEISIKVASAPKKYYEEAGAVDFDSAVTPSGIVNGVEETPAKNGDGYNAYYNNDFTFKLTAATSGATIKEVCYFIGTEDELWTYMALPEAERSALPTLTPDASGVYKLGKELINTLEGDEDNPTIFVLADTVEPATIAVTPDYSTVETGADLSEAIVGLLPGVKVADLSAITAAEAAEIQKTTPAVTTYGKDLVYTYILADGYASAVAETAYKTVDENIVQLDVDDPTISVKGSGASAYRVATFKIPWKDIEDAEGLTFVFKGVTQTYTVAFGDTDENITNDSYTGVGKAAANEGKSFMLTAKEFYEIANAGLSARIAAAESADTKEALFASGIYAIDASVTNKSLATNNQVYKVNLSIDGGKGFVNCTITDSLADTGIASNLKVYLGSLTRGVEAAVTLEDANSGIRNSSEITELKGYYDEDLEIPVTLEEDHKLLSFTYSIGGAAPVSVPTKKVNGVTKYYIPGSAIKGNIALTALTVDGSTDAAVTIVGENAAAVAQVTAVKTAIGTDGSKSYQGTESDVILTAAQAGEVASYAAVTKKDGTTSPKAGDQLTITVTLAFPEYLIDLNEVNAVNEDTYRATKVTASGKTFTITGSVLAAGNITIPVSGTGSLKLTVTDNDAAKIVSGNLYVKEVPAAVMEIGDAEAIAAISFTKITSPYNVAKAPEGTGYIFRHKAYGAEANYKVAPGVGLTKDDEASDDSYTVYEPVVMQPGSKELTLATKIKAPTSKTVYLFNKDSVNVTRAAMTVDQAPTTAAAMETYLKDYLTNASSAKAGVYAINDGVTANGYRVYNGTGIVRTSTAKVDPKNLVVTFTVAANREPVVTAVTGATLKTSTGAAYTSGVTDTTKAVTYVWTMPKGADELTDGKVLDIDTKASAVADAITVTPSIADSIAVFASVDGKQVATTDNKVTANVGDKVVLTVVPAEGYSIVSASNLVSTATTAKETTIASKPEGFKTTITVAAGTANAVSVTTIGDVAFQPLTAEDADLAVTKPGTAKTVVNTKTKQEVTSYTYDALIVGKNYTIPKYELAGEDTTITSFEVTPDAKDDDTEFAVDEGTLKFQIGAKDAGTSFKVKVNGYDAAYTLKAAKVLTADGITIKGTTKSGESLILKQEIGTTGLYTVSPASGMSLKGIKVTAGGAVAKLVTDLEIEDEDQVVYDKNGSVSLRINTVSKTDVDVTLTIGAVAKTFTVKPDDSKLNGTKPSVTLKSATSESMLLTLALPSAVSSNTLKKLASPDNNLFYEVNITDGEISNTQYFLVSGASQEVTPDLSAFEEAEWYGGAKNFAVSAKVYLLNAAQNAEESVIEAAIEDSEKNFASSDSSDYKTVSTKDLRYPKTLRINPAGNKLYAGQDYEQLTFEELMKSGKLPANTELLTIPYDNSGDVQWRKTAVYVLGKVLPDSAATIPNPSVVDDPEDDYAYEITPMDDSMIASATAGAAFVYDGKLMVPLDFLDSLSTQLYGDQDFMIKVTAPRESASISEEVSATLKVSLQQRAVYYYDEEDTDFVGNIYPLPGDTLSVVKKNGAAATINLGIEYVEMVEGTKASLNKFTYKIDDVSNISKSDLSVANGKVTVAKDFVFPKDGDVSFTVTATSDYNKEGCKLVYDVTLVPAEEAQPQGEAVLATTDGEAKTHLVARNGGKLTNKELEEILEVNNDLKVIYLLPNAVIPETGEINNDYIVDDTNITTVSSNTKLLFSSTGIAVYDEADATSSSLLLQYEKSIGSVTLTSVAENTGTKKTLRLTIAAGDTKATKTESPAYTITVNETSSAAADDPTKYAVKNETIEVEDSGRLFDIQVMRGVIDLTASPVNWAETPAELDDYYSASQLKASAGATLVYSNVRKGEYAVIINGKSGKVTVNGVTYTIVNTAKENAVSAGSISHTDLYANYGYNQTVAFTASNKSFVQEGMKAVLSPDYAVAAEKDILYIMDELELIELEGETDTYTLDVDVENDKAVFDLDLATSAVITLPKGSYSFYVTYIAETGEVLTEPAKVTLTIKDAPKFNLKTNYTVALSSSYEYGAEGPAVDTAVLQLTDSTGKKTAKIIGIRNMNVNGRDNDFNGLFADAQGYKNDGILVLEENNALLSISATKANCTGWITYTTDNITEQSAKVTLSFTADADVAADAIEDGIEEEASSWSVQNMTATKALAAIKALVNVPSGISISFKEFDTAKNYNADALKTGAPVTFYATLMVKQGKEEIEKDLAFTIPTRVVTVTKFGQIAGITYSLKDGANNTVTNTAGVTIPVLNGAVLTVKEVAPVEGYKPDKYEFVGYGVEKVQKNAGVSFGEIKEVGAVEVSALNTITLKKGANVADVSLYQDSVVEANLKGQTGASKSSVMIDVLTGSTIALTATNAKGYDVNVKETVTKNNLTTTGVGGDDVTPKTFTFEEGAATYVLSNIHAARTFDASAVAHLYAIEPNISNADGVVTLDTLEVKKGNVWGAPEDLYGAEFEGKIPVAFGSTAQFRFFKEKKVDAAKAGAFWTMTVTHGDTPIKDSTASSAYATYTTTKLTKDNTAYRVMVFGQQNSGLTVTYSDKANDRAISDIRLVVYFSEDTEYANPIGSIKMTSGKQVIVPEDIYAYRVEYSVKKGWRDLVSDGVAAAEKTTESGILESENHTLESFAEGNIQNFVLTAKKDTKIGHVDLSKLHGSEEVGGVFENTEGLTYTWNKGKISDTFNLSASEVTDMDPVTNKQTIAITVTTKDGYDLSLLTYKAGAAKPAVAKMTLKSTNPETGAKTWTANVSVTNDVAAIGFQPTAQSRSITVTDTLPAAKVNSVYYYTVASTAKKTGKTGVGANTAITAPYGSEYVVCFTTPKGVAEDAVKLVSTSGDDEIGDPVKTGTAETTGLTYTYTVKSATATGKASVLKIQAAE